MKKKINPRAELISFMRGFFVCPIIAFLHYNNLIEKIIYKNFNSSSFNIIKNKVFIEKILDYLVSLGLLSKHQNKFKTTGLGKKIFLRSGSFLLLHSYKPFINNLEKSLIKSKKISASCDRSQNVIGSGSTNNKKFFPKAIELVKNENIGLIADIGCGDGNFLSQISKKFPSAPIFASDLSKIAVNAAKKRLSKYLPKHKKFFFVCDAANVKKWSNEIKKIKIKKNTKILISVWYILHEISNHNKNNIIKFFKNIKRYLPNSIVLIGEITKMDNKVLVENKHTSIMPEFLFFHELSGQGVLKYEDYGNILKKIPFKLLKNIKFDVMKVNKRKVPSAFIWLLRNKKVI